MKAAAGIAVGAAILFCMWCSVVTIPAGFVGVSDLFGSVSEEIYKSGRCRGPWIAGGQMDGFLGSVKGVQEP